MLVRIFLIMCIAGLATLTPSAGQALAHQPGRITADNTQGGDSMDADNVSDEDLRRLLLSNGVSPELLNEVLGGGHNNDVNSGGVQFTKAWEYESSDLFNLLRARVDVDGDIVVFGSGHLDKIDGATNSSPSSVWTNPVDPGNLISTVSDLEVSLDGDIYVTGGSPGALEPAIMKVSRFGFIVWQRRYPKLGDVEPAYDLELSSDGVPFFVTGHESPRVFQIDPRTGAVGWELLLEGPEANACIPDAQIEFVDLVLDGDDNLYAFAQEVTTDSTLVFSLDSARGNIRWCVATPLSYTASLAGNVVATDFMGNVYVAGANGNQGVVHVLEPEAGTLIRQEMLSQLGQSFTIEDMQVFTDNSIIVGGQRIDAAEVAQAAFVARFAPDPSDDWFTITSTTTGAFSRVRAIDLDRFGNVFVATQEHNDSDSLSRTSRVKFEDAGVLLGGTIQWTDLDTITDSGVSDVSPRDIVVDRGGNSYTISVRTIPPGSSGPQIIKHTQPVELAPTRQTASAELKLENRSIWADTVGSLQEDADLFTFGPNESIPPFGPVWPLSFQIGGIVDTIIFGEWGAQVTFDFSGVINMGVRAEVDGGTADIHLPFDLEWKIPNPETLNSTDQDVIIESDWTPDPGARLTSCFTPRVNAGVTAGGSFSALIHVQAEAASFEVLNENLLDIPTQTFETDYIPGFSLSDLLTTFGSGTSDDVKITIADNRGLLTGTFSVPSLRAKSGYDATNGRFMTNVDVLEEDSRFLSIRASITEAVLTSFGASATFSYDLPRNAQDDEDFKLSAFASLLQLSSGLDLGIGQQIGVDTIPMIRYTFPGIPMMDDIVLQAGEDLVFPLPANKSFDIVPFIETPTTFSNRTTVAAIPGISFEALRLGLSASAFGFDVVSGFGYCLGCYNWDISEILTALGLPGDLINIEIPVFDSSWDTVDFPAIQLPCIRVVGDVNQTPRLMAASRGAVDMIIYDQTSPSVSSFNVATDGKTRMLLYGEEFMNNSLVVKIEHNGRIETLTDGNGLTHINDFTLLVEIPNILRLTPGIAKVWIENSFGNSETIDLCIEYPTPRLDAVNPNLWAADPSLATVPVSVIDAKSFIGNDTYIARRDYWIKMRDELWSSFTAGGLTAQEYFPLFDFDQLPGFPAVLWKKGLSSFVGTNFPAGANAYIAARPASEHDRFGLLTLEAWVRPNLGASGFHQIFTNSPDDSGGYRWGIFPSGAMRFTTWGIADYDTPAGLVPDGVWSHVAVVFTSGKCEFYLNGELVSTVNRSLNSFGNPNAQVMIGGTPTGNRFVGDIAEVRFWNIPRSAQQIHDNLARPLNGSEDRLIGYWPLNERIDFGEFNGGTPGANGIDDRSPTNAIGEAFNVADQNPRVLFPPSLPIAPFPLPRFIQPVDNGIHNVRLTVDLYESPQSVRVALCNPGPGGGMSNEVNLTIAAPVPVVSGVEPANISPLDIVLDQETLEPQPLLLTIVGPTNVPTFEGFEEPKFGNFNRDSVVYYNGEALETQYNGSANLTAILPPELITEGDHFVNVFTPSNGTQYFEQRFRDVDGDGEPDDEDPMTFGVQPFEQMLVSSGGASNPVFFRVRYRDPVIKDLFPERAEQGLAAIDAGQMLVVTTDAPGAAPMVALPYNMTITGSDFRPGAVVYFGDELRNSEVVDSTCIRVELLPEDVDVVGTYPITVLNPGNPPIPSVAATFEVMAPGVRATALRQQRQAKPRHTHTR